MSQNAHDLSAEMALLGAMISAPGPSLAAFQSVAPEAYWSPRHQMIASVLVDMVARQTPIDAITLLVVAEDLGIAAKIGGGPYIHSLLAACPTAANADFYAERLCELYGRRMLTESLTREVDRLDAAWESGEHTAAAEAVLRVRMACDEVTMYTSCGPTMEITYLAEFLDREFPRNWLVPGLLERGDRLILTGQEGFGKTELAVQVACCVAGGIHPFTGKPLREAARVAVIDCENPQGLTQRRFRKIVGAVQTQRINHGAEYLDWSKHLAVEFRTDGLNLLSGTDVAWLERYVAAATPDLLLLGPLYKLMGGADENDGKTASALRAVLDGIRARHGCALITEAHAGHAKDDSGRMMRPRGHSMWLGWPEFGLGLRRSKDDPDGQAEVVSWRGDREARAWPKILFKGAVETFLPWLPNEEYRDLEADMVYAEGM